MKKLLQLLSICILIISLFSTCSLEKRRYMPGYNIEWNKSKQDSKKVESAQNNKSDGKIKIITPKPETVVNLIGDETLIASSENSSFNTLSFYRKSVHSANIVSEDCDILFLKNGNEIRVAMFQIIQNEIKYRKCEDTSGTTYTIDKSKLFMIKYANGTKDLFYSDTSVENKKKPIEKEDSGIFGILSFVTFFLGFLFAGPGSLILIPIALVLAIIGLGRKRKFKGFAIATLSLIIGFILLIFLILLTLNN